MDFFVGFLVVFSSLLVSESALARLAGGAVCLLFGFWARFFGGRPSVWLAPLLLVSCFLRTFPLWGFFTGELGDVRGAILFLLAWLVIFLLAANKKEAPCRTSRGRAGGLPVWKAAQPTCGGGAKSSLNDGLWRH